MCLLEAIAEQWSATSTLLVMETNDPNLFIVWEGCHRTVACLIGIQTLRLVANYAVPCKVYENSMPRELCAYVGSHANVGHALAIPESFTDKVDMIDVSALCLEEKNKGNKGWKLGYVAIADVGLKPGEKALALKEKRQPKYPRGSAPSSIVKTYTLWRRWRVVPGALSLLRQFNTMSNLDRAVERDTCRSMLDSGPARDDYKVVEDLSGDPFVANHHYPGV